ncbi:helix-turn-helix transcriptional regulator [Paraburkholderia dioscoreae]|uniref:Helix-turn-helix family protein n=1 Tax=Paraburkholderia dioscoreae TaxID=2604047 RepID=A0A5Q4YWR8_9BURK|nr:helix-turn-helix transcriptional regulator [Paraburkholderia dioscoreae]VVD31052.1 Helix-turn-helix family protein [Paraburkholderia dioscoreae]
MPPNIHDDRYRILREHLLALRLKAGLTQAELAQKLGADQSHLSKIERGERYVDTLLFLDWCRACGNDPLKAMRRLIDGGA